MRVQLVKSNTAQRRRSAKEAAIHNLLAQSNRVEKMRAAVAIHHRDAHLRHDLRQPKIKRMQQICFALFRIQTARCLQRKPRTDRSRAHAQQHRDMMQIAAIASLNRQANARTFTGANQRMMHGSGGQRHRDRQRLFARSAISQQQNRRSATHNSIALAQMSSTP